jgi:hypothetical protein
MTSVQAQLKIKNGLNKLDSKDHPNILAWKMEEAVNTEARRFCRIRIAAKESDLKLTDDLQVLLKSAKLSGSNKSTYFLSHKLPSDYFAHSRVTPICNKDNCVAVRIPSILQEDANVDEFLSDYSSQPSFDFEQAFHILGGNKIKIYHNGDFEVKEAELEYFRTPQYITFLNTPQTNGGVGKDMVWEFKDDICDLIIEGAIGILAGDTENINRMQIAQGIVQQTK